MESFIVADQLIGPNNWSNVFQLMMI